MRRTQAYQVNMSVGDPVKIDQEELPKVIQGIANGQPILVKRGLINPSYYVTITRDKDRMTEWTEETNYADGSGKKAYEKGIMPLPDIFKGMDKKNLLKSG